MEKKIAILGAGESGVGAAVLAKKKGYKVFVSDFGKIKQKYKDVLSNFEIDFEEEKHTERIILQAKEIVKSPGIPEKVSIVQKAFNLEIPVISEIEFAARYTTGKKVCITGSNGKTTTTLWTYHILKNAGLDVGLAGNVGKSFAWQVAERDHDYWVLEISSFQLDGMFDFKADIAILMNITPDHLDRYDYNFQGYVDSKFRIIRNQEKEDHFIYWNDDPVIQKELSNQSLSSQKWPFSNHPVIDKKGAWIENNEIIINIKNSEVKMTLEQLALQGKHNAYNSMAAGVAARLLDIRKDYVKQSLTDFQHVEHRLEFVAKVRGVEFINDSKATNVNSTWYALESINKPMVWIVGGVDKGNDYASLKTLAAEKVKAIVCLGLDNRKIYEEFGDIVETIVSTASAKDAVDTAYYMGEPGDVVLLSPACASFDLFENYEDRGNKFKRAVRDL